MKAITVFCGSGLSNDSHIISEAYNLGLYLAKQEITLIYGGAKIGLMGKVAEGVLDNNGRVIGVIPDFLTTKEVVHEGLTELIVTQTMHERKNEMHNLCDGLIALPGGFGTMEELFEALTWAQLGLHQKPIGLLNSNGFYEDLLQLVKTMISKELLQSSYEQLLVSDKHIESLIDKMKQFEPHPVPEWMNKHL